MAGVAAILRPRAARSIAHPSGRPWLLGQCSDDAVTVGSAGRVAVAAADQAGMSRRYGGIHFKSGDEHGRSLGRVIGYNDDNLAQQYINGTVTP